MYDIVCHRAEQQWINQTDYCKKKDVQCEDKVNDGVNSWFTKNTLVNPND